MKFRILCLTTEKYFENVMNRFVCGLLLTFSMRCLDVSLGLSVKCATKR